MQKLIRLACKGLVPVMAVAMTVAFPAMDHDKEEIKKEVRKQVREILNGLSACTMESTLEVKLIQAGTVLSFTLVGDNKIDVVSHLEDMVYILSKFFGKLLNILANFMILGEIWTFGAGNGRTHDAGR